MSGPASREVASQDMSVSDRRVLVTLADLTCETCGSYVHPFLDRCPGCDARRRSYYEALLADPTLDTHALAGDPAVVQAAAESLRRATLTSTRRGLGSRQATRPDLESAGVVDAAAMIDYACDGLTYRLRGVAEAQAAPIDGAIRAAPDALVLSTARGHRTLAGVPAWSILGACPRSAVNRRSPDWNGVSFRGSPVPAVAGVARGDLLVIHASGQGIAAFSLANPSGLFATRATPAHYEEVARWIGLFSITAAEARWHARGVAPYAGELGLLPDAGRESVLPGKEGSPPQGSASPPARTVREALAELEGLRAGGLVTDAEYDQKRREILRRL
jgi:hypothetical protein